MDPIIGLGLIVIVVIVELVLSGTWSRFYFEKGIPIFSYEIPRTNYGSTPMTTEQLEEKFKSTASMPLQFREIDEESLAFREAFWGGFFRFSYTPIMHGNLQYTPDFVKVTGLANWFPLVFLVFALSVMFDRDKSGNEAWVFPLFLFGIIGLIYSIQVYRYRRIAKVAATDKGDV